MAWPTIDENKPIGTDKVKMIDDAEREVRLFTKTALKQICNYTDNGTQPALRTTVWTTATRPTGTNLVDRVTGLNTTLGYEEYYDLATTTWKQKTTNAFIQSLIDAVVPIGSVMMWSGATTNIPAKWHLCDGTNGTVDLRNRFVLGAGSTYAVAATGGEATHVLTIGEMPAHTHTISPFTAAREYAGPNNEDAWDSRKGGAVTTSSTGGGQAHNNMPPYFSIAFIQRIA